MSKRDLTAETLREYLSYDPETGVFTRRNRVSNVAAGTVAGSVNSRGYLQIRINHVLYTNHRLAWLYVYGMWPTKHLDHVNGVRTDNRLCNLREVTRHENAQNQRSPQGKNPYLGVTCRNNRWRARIAVDGRLVQVGTFDTAEGARDAYLEAKRKLHAGCTI